MKGRKIEKKSEVMIYQAKSGAIELRGDFCKETVWATQDQIADLFSTTKQNISLHFKNIFKNEELTESSVVKEFLTTAKDGKKYKVKFYNLDAILSAGYRVNSRQAAAFRKWATNVLRKHLVDGYTINKARIAKNYDAFLQAVADVKALLPKGATVDTESVLELITLFADTWLSLDAYDKDALQTKGVTKKRVAITAEKLAGSIADFKTILVDKGEATEIFAAERSVGSISGIVGNVMQSFGGNDLYGTVEEKAAHLLYFIVKNHPFVDGNKRSGAYAFVWFLRQARILDTARMTPPALTAITLLIAESDPTHKEKMVRLVLQLLKKGK